MSSRNSRPMKKSTTNGSRISRVTRLRNVMPNEVFGANQEANFAAVACLRLRNGISRS